MDMSQFRKYLSDINGRNLHPQASALYEAKELAPAKGVPGSAAAKKLYQQGNNTYEETVVEFLNQYFGDTLSEDTSDEEILESVGELNLVCAAVNEFVETEDADYAEIVEEYFSSYFGDALSEDTSDEEVIEAISELNRVCAEVNAFFSDE